MADIEETIRNLNDIAEMLYAMYRDETDRHEIAVRYDQYRAVDDAIELLKSQQAEIERLQPKKGKWIEIESQTGVGAFGFNEVTVNAFRCSECRKKIDVSDGDFKYCPYCGAEMDN